MNFIYKESKYKKFFFGMGGGGGGGRKRGGGWVGGWGWRLE